MSLTTETSFPAAAAPETPEAGVGVQLDALLHHAGIVPLATLGWLRITGEDRVRWLNGMVTNSIQALQPGDGCYNFVLSAQGRIQGDGTAFATPSALLLETSRTRLPELMALLDRFIIMDDVELQDVSSTQIGLAIIGPRAAEVLGKIGLDLAPQATPSLTHTEWQSAKLTVVHAHSPLVPRFELWIDATDPTDAEALQAALESEGATLCGPDAAEALRLLEGTPVYGIDIREKELPQETAQGRALHFAKGCYLGQEIVERIRSRGAVHRTFSGFAFTGDLPAAGTILEAEGKAAGEITSAARIPLASGLAQRALGYIRREVLDRNLPITYAGGSVTPAALPFAEHR